MAFTWDEILNMAPHSTRCPRCLTQAPAWAWVRADGLWVLTHDGNTICPRDSKFGWHPETAPARLAVAA
ncbi:hypothetical protein AB0K43_06840 [Kitasatospora sp. NPDC049258]|uniref:hypothetical protein n=1 Tax=Kitasatospora sp. NPDC049258 TaxID=3155394 RepID=UPI0034468897